MSPSPSSCGGFSRDLYLDTCAVRVEAHPEIAYPPRFVPRRDWQEHRLPPMPLTEGRTYEAWHPFLREEYQEHGFFDDDRPSEGEIHQTWRPGWTYEPSGPEDVEEVWHGDGEQLRTIISIHKPGTYPARVFYVRQWRDPDGKVFGKTALRCVVASAFRRWVRGERWPSYSPAREAHVRWALTPFSVQPSGSAHEADRSERQPKPREALPNSFQTSGTDDT